MTLLCLLIMSKYIGDMFWYECICDMSLLINDKLEFWRSKRHGNSEFMRGWPERSILECFTITVFDLC